MKNSKFPKRKPPVSYEARKIKNFSIIFLIFIFLSFLPNLVLAQPCPGGLVPCGRDCDVPDTSWNETDRCQICHFFIMFDQIIDFFMIRLVPVVAVLMLVVGGIMFFFAGGSPGILNQAKSIITSTILGLIIIYAAWIIVNTFLVIIGVASWTGLATGWFSIECKLP